MILLTFNSLAESSVTVGLVWQVDADPTEHL